MIGHFSLLGGVLHEPGHEGFQVLEVALRGQGTHDKEVAEELVARVFLADFKLVCLRERLVKVAKVERSLDCVQNVEVVHLNDLSY